jgi:hypothetical protein
VTKLLHHAWRDGHVPQDAPEFRRAVRRRGDRRWTRRTRAIMERRASACTTRRRRCWRG